MPTLASEASGRSLQSIQESEDQAHVRPAVRPPPAAVQAPPSQRSLGTHSIESLQSIHSLERPSTDAASGVQQPSGGGAWGTARGSAPVPVASRTAGGPGTASRSAAAPPSGGLFGGDGAGGPPARRAPSERSRELPKTSSFGVESFDGSEESLPRGGRAQQATGQRGGTGGWASGGGGGGGGAGGGWASSAGGGGGGGGRSQGRGVGGERSFDDEESEEPEQRTSDGRTSAGIQSIHSFGRSEASSFRGRRDHPGGGGGGGGPRATGGWATGGGGGVGGGARASALADAPSFKGKRVVAPAAASVGGWGAPSRARVDSGARSLDSDEEEEEEEERPPARRPAAVAGGSGGGQVASLGGWAGPPKPAARADSGLRSFDDSEEEEEEEERRPQGRPAGGAAGASTSVAGGWGAPSRGQGQGGVHSFSGSEASLPQGRRPGGGSAAAAASGGWAASGSAAQRQPSERQRPTAAAAASSTRSDDVSAEVERLQSIHSIQSLSGGSVGQESPRGRPGASRNVIGGWGEGGATVIRRPPPDAAGGWGMPAGRTTASAAGPVWKAPPPSLGTFGSMGAAGARGGLASSMPRPGAGVRGTSMRRVDSFDEEEEERNARARASMARQAPPPPPHGDPSTDSLSTEHAGGLSGTLPSASASTSVHAPRLLRPRDVPPLAAASMGRPYAREPSVDDVDDVEELEDDTKGRKGRVSDASSKDAAAAARWRMAPEAKAAQSRATQDWGVDPIRPIAAAAPAPAPYGEPASAFGRTSFPERTSILDRTSEQDRTSILDRTSEQDRTSAQDRASRMAHTLLSPKLPPRYSAAGMGSGSGSGDSGTGPDGDAAAEYDAVDTGAEGPRGPYRPSSSRRYDESGPYGGAYDDSPARDKLDRGATSGLGPAPSFPRMGSVVRVQHEEALVRDSHASDSTGGVVPGLGNAPSFPRVGSVVRVPSSDSWRERAGDDAPGFGDRDHRGSMPRQGSALRDGEGDGDGFDEGGTAEFADLASGGVDTMPPMPRQGSVSRAVSHQSRPSWRRGESREGSHDGEGRRQREQEPEGDRYSRQGDRERDSSGRGSNRSGTRPANGREPSHDGDRPYGRSAPSTRQTSARPSDEAEREGYGGRGYKREESRRHDEDRERERERPSRGSSRHTSSRPSNEPTPAQGPSTDDGRSSRPSHPSRSSAPDSSRPSPSTAPDGSRNGSASAGPSGSGSGGAGTSGTSGGGPSGGSGQPQRSGGGASTSSSDGHAIPEPPVPPPAAALSRESSGAQFGLFSRHASFQLRTGLPQGPAPAPALPQGLPTSPTQPSSALAQRPPSVRSLSRQSSLARDASRDGGFDAQASPPPSPPKPPEGADDDPHSLGPELSQDGSERSSLGLGRRSLSRHTSLREPRASSGGGSASGADGVLSSPNGAAAAAAAAGLGGHSWRRSSSLGGSSRHRGSHDGGPLERISSQHSSLRRSHEGDGEGSVGGLGDAWDNVGGATGFGSPSGRWAVTSPNSSLRRLGSARGREEHPHGPGHWHAHPHSHSRGSLEGSVDGEGGAAGRGGLLRGSREGSLVDEEEMLRRRQLSGILEEPEESGVATQDPSPQKGNSPDKKGAEEEGDDKAGEEGQAEGEEEQRPSGRSRSGASLDRAPGTRRSDQGTPSRAASRRESETGAASAAASGPGGLSRSSSHAVSREPSGRVSAGPSRSASMREHRPPPLQLDGFGAPTSGAAAATPTTIPGGGTLPSREPSHTTMAGAGADADGGALRRASSRRDSGAVTAGAGAPPSRAARSRHAADMAAAAEAAAASFRQRSSASMRRPSERHRPDGLDRTSTAPPPPDATAPAPSRGASSRGGWERIGPAPSASTAPPESALHPGPHRGYDEHNPPPLPPSQLPLPPLQAPSDLGLESMRPTVTRHLAHAHARAHHTRPPLHPFTDPASAGGDARLGPTDRFLLTRALAPTPSDSSSGALGSEASDVGASLDSTDLRRLIGPTTGRFRPPALMPGAWQPPPPDFSSAPPPPRPKERLEAVGMQGFGGAEGALLADELGAWLLRTERMEAELSLPASSPRSEQSDLLAIPGGGNLKPKPSPARTSERQARPRERVAVAPPPAAKLSDPYPPPPSLPAWSYAPHGAPGSLPGGSTLGPSRSTTAGGAGSRGHTYGGEWAQEGPLTVGMPPSPGAAAAGAAAAGGRGLSRLEAEVPDAAAPAPGRPLPDPRLPSPRSPPRPTQTQQQLQPAAPQPFGPAGPWAGMGSPAMMPSITQTQPGSLGITLQVDTGALQAVLAHCLQAALLPAAMQVAAPLQQQVAAMQAAAAGHTGTGLGPQTPIAQAAQAQPQALLQQYQAQVAALQQQQQQGYSQPMPMQPQFPPQFQQPYQPYQAQQVQPAPYQPYQSPQPAAQPLPQQPQLYTVQPLPTTQPMPVPGQGQGQQRERSPPTSPPQQSPSQSPPSNTYPPVSRSPSRLSVRWAQDVADPSSSAFASGAPLTAQSSSPMSPAVAGRLRSPAGGPGPGRAFDAGTQTACDQSIQVEIAEAPTAESLRLAAEEAALAEAEAARAEAEAARLQAEAAQQRSRQELRALIGVSPEPGSTTATNRQSACSKTPITSGSSKAARQPAPSDYSYNYAYADAGNDAHGEEDQDPDPHPDLDLDSNPEEALLFRSGLASLLLEDMRRDIRKRAAAGPPGHPAVMAPGNRAGTMEQRAAAAAAAAASTAIGVRRPGSGTVGSGSGSRAVGLGGDPTGSPAPVQAEKRQRLVPLPVPAHVSAPAGFAAAAAALKAPAGGAAAAIGGAGLALAAAASGAATRAVVLDTSGASGDQEGATVRLDTWSGLPAPTAGTAPSAAAAGSWLGAGVTAGSSAGLGLGLGQGGAAAGREVVAARSARAGAADALHSNPLLSRFAPPSIASHLGSARADGAGASAVPFLSVHGSKARERAAGALPTPSSFAAATPGGAGAAGGGTATMPSFVPLVRQPAPSGTAVPPEVLFGPPARNSAGGAGAGAGTPGTGMGVGMGAGGGRMPWELPSTTVLGPPPAPAGVSASGTAGLWPAGAGVSGLTAARLGSTPGMAPRAGLAAGVGQGVGGAGQGAGSAGGPGRAGAGAGGEGHGSPPAPERQSEMMVRFLSSLEAPPTRS
ncbi:hypothetical protein HYH03_016656 [Edaphochlamys debaryana]|uniref:Uncharacterized protein n=1 Tax=Edaphochlamys debaryana TaxID=47281 RepID=A0A835XIN2_9CHLO|nr:hypothetical protein HYH03_016656 [Edaphochlamys debaryana]|eukprot:KAG2484516.1 hypothetical protein HYH03_016656 [Edaphochlamys debaryana]